MFYGHRCERQRARTYGGRSKTPVLLTNTIKTKISCVEIEMQNKIYSIASDVIKELVNAFSCVYIEVQKHLESLEGTQEARVFLGCASSNCYTLSFCSPKFPRASITQYS